ncbi:MAG: hypothetical protein IPI32_07380 [Austwickia sp.]|jgi:hypothetical protein|nr:hypothetical protein [Austwickia sp.]
MPPIVSRFRQPLRASGATRATATLLAAAVIGTGAALSVPSANASVPSAVAALAAPTCTPVEPATLTAQVTQPTSVWDSVGITFSGSLPATVPAGACVTIPSSPDLPMRTFGEYPALNPAGERVGTMVVEAAGITFLFDDAFVSTHTNVTFSGYVKAEMKVNTTAVVEPYTITWTLPALATPIEVQVPACPECGSVPAISGKYATLDDKARIIYSGVVFGTADWSKVPGTSKTVNVTMRDVLGPGQECLDAEVDNLSLKTTVRTLTCPTLSVTFPATRGQSYRLKVRTRVNPPYLSSYTDTGTITAAGVTILQRTATAEWHDGGASVSGGTPLPTTTITVPSGPATGPGPTPTGPTPTTTSPSPSTSTATLPNQTVTPGPVPGPVPGPGPVPNPSPSLPELTPTPTATTTPAPTTPSTSTPAPPVSPVPPTTPSPSTSLPRTTPTNPPSTSGLVRRTFQVDRYLPRTRYQALRVARFDDDRLLHFREDRPMWGASRYQLITLMAPANASPSWLIAQLNARTRPGIGDVRTTATLPGARAGRAYVVAWELGTGASATHPWGRAADVPQRFIARS